MNSKGIFFALGCILAFWISTTDAMDPVIGAPLIATGIGGGIAVAVGLYILAKAKIGAAAVGYFIGRSVSHAYGGYGRHKRSAVPVEDIYEEIIWESVSQFNDDNCLERFVCETASGSIKSETYNEIVKDLLTKDLNKYVESAEFSFIRAAKVGSVEKKASICRDAFKCQYTGPELLQRVGEFTKKS